MIRQQHCVLQEENASKNAIIKILVKNQAAINQASNEVKNATDQAFQKIKLKRKSINYNINHLPKAKSNQEIKLVNRCETLYFGYESSETEDTSSDSESEISTDTSNHSIQKKVKEQTTKPAG